MPILPQNLPVFITTNPHKVDELSEFCGIAIPTMAIDGIEEIQHTDPREVTRHKAASAYARLGQTCFCEDVGLAFHAFGGFPGALIKWLVTEAPLENVTTAIHATKDTRATFTVAIGYANETGEITTFSASTEWTIVAIPRGDCWGANPIFVPDGETRTFGELTFAEKQAFHPRIAAFKQLLAHLETLN